MFRIVFTDQFENELDAPIYVDREHFRQLIKIYLDGEERREIAVGTLQVTENLFIHTMIQTEIGWVATSDPDFDIDSVFILDEPEIEQWALSEVADSHYSPAEMVEWLTSAYLVDDLDDVTVLGFMNNDQIIMALERYMQPADVVLAQIDREVILAMSPYQASGCVRPEPLASLVDWPEREWECWESDISEGRQDYDGSLDWPIPF